MGQTFGQALLRYQDSALIGLRQADGRVLLNPGMAITIEPGDRVIAMSEDDDTIRLASGTEQEIDRAAAEAAVRHSSGLRHLTVTFQSGDTTDRRTLEALDVSSYQHVIILSYSERLGPQEADARTLITLLHLRQIAAQSDYSFSIISEMLDIRNRDLAGVTRADDFIVSDKLVSLMLSQVSENKELTAVFADLFDPQGSELYLKPAGHYVALERPVSFYTVVEAARQRGEVAIGYRQQDAAEDPARSYGVRVNPRKSDQVAFTAGDQIIVLAED